MIITKYAFYLSLFAIIVALFGVSNTALADHEAMVAGQVVPLADASLEHGANCDDVHYHGELNGVPDPAPDGCGHGIVTILPHDEDDESIIPEEKTEEKKTKSPSVWERFTDWLDVLVQGITGGFSPKTVSDSVDIVEEAAPSIAENVENIEEYRESVDEGEDTLGIYREPDSGLEEGSLSQRFFRWINSLID